MSNIIFIKSICREGQNIVADISLNDKITEQIHTTVSENVANDLCTDRIDAYVFGLLHFALENHYDFCSEIPITEDIYYNLETCYIDALVNANPHLHRVKINAPIIKVCNTHKAKFVATGISCGVDSLYTVAQHSKEQVPDSYVVDTLCFFNVGSSMKYDSLHSPLTSDRYKLTKSFAEEYGYNFIFLESDIFLFIHRNSQYGYSHIENHSFMAIYAVLSLQNVISIYYYAAGYTISDFSVQNIKDSAKYDMLTMSCASIPGKIVFHSTGASVKRSDKVKFLSDYHPAQKYLNVCVENIKNDGTCFKCVRTLLELDAANAIDKFGTVFDINFYKANRKLYLRRLYIDAILKKDSYLQEIYPYFSSEITLLFKIQTLWSILRNKLTRTHYNAI